MGVLRRLLDKCQTYEIYRNDVAGFKELYLRRYHIFPWGGRVEGTWKEKFPFAIKIHEICLSDWGRSLHDHPWPFVTVLLKGEYWETRPKDLGTMGGETVEKRHGEGSVLFRRAEDLHMLRLDKPVWTLVFMGPHKRNWGFDVDGTWVAHEDYEQLGQGVGPTDD